MIDTLLELTRLKHLPRSGWLRVGVAKPESVAGHSWGVACLTLLLLPDDMSRERALQYALLHDLAEVRTGDVTPHDGIAREEKVRREREAMKSLCDGLPNGQKLEALWCAYEHQEDPESRFVRELDRLDMALQALAYAQEGHDIREFLCSADPHITHPTLRSIMDALWKRCDRSSDATPPPPTSGNT